MSRIALFGLLTLLLSSPARGEPPPASPGLDGAAALAVSVSETADAVRVRVQVTGTIEPGSLEVGFEGRKAIVSARDAGGRPLPPQTVQLPAAVVEEGATADTDADDALVITLRKQRPGAERGTGSAAR